MMKQQNQRGSSNGHSQTGQTQAGQVQRTLEQSKEMVSEYPISSLLVVFGLGVGLGVLLSETLVAPMMQPKCAMTNMSERLGHQIYDAIASAIPDSIMRKLPV